MMNKKNTLPESSKNFCSELLYFDLKFLKISVCPE